MGGWGEFYPFFLGFLEFVNFAKPPKRLQSLKQTIQDCC